MSRKQLVLLAGAVGISLLCGGGAAMAQGYGYDDYSGRTYSDDRAASQPYNYERPYDQSGDQSNDYARPGDRVYDRVTPEGVSETVIVHPYYDEVRKRQLLGNVDGQINPTEFSLSRPVDYSDLDLSRDADFRELQARVYDTAEQVCAELDARVPDLRDEDGDRECVRNATRDAMRQFG